MLESLNLWALGIALEKEPNKLYLDSYFSGMDELNYCYINEYLGTRLREIITAQLAAYVKARSHRYDFYKPLNEDGINRFYTANIWKLDYSVAQPSFSFDCEELINGIVSTQINNQTLQYNFRKNEVQAECPLFYLLYKDNLDMIVAKEQLRLGIAPRAFTELYNFQKALCDKQTVTVVFKDGETASIRRTSFSINDVYSFTVEANHISYALNKFNLNYYGSNTATDVDYLKLGKIKYQINGGNLNNLYEPVAADHSWRVA